MNLTADDRELRQELPSLYELEAHEHLPDVREAACARARQGADEGTLLWARTQQRWRRQDGRCWHSWSGNLHAALVLRPELPPQRWPELIAVLCVSLGGAIAEHCQPLTPLGYRWPDLLCLGPDPLASLTLDRGADWVVLGCCVNVTSPDQPGRYPCLALDGGSEVGAGALLGRSMRFFLDWVNRWAEEGFEPVRRAWLARRLLDLSGNQETGAIAVSVDAAGALQLRIGERLVTRGLTAALETPSASGGTTQPAGGSEREDG